MHKISHQILAGSKNITHLLLQEGKQLALTKYDSINIKILNRAQSYPTAIVKKGWWATFLVTPTSTTSSLRRNYDRRFVPFNVTTPMTKAVNERKQFSPEECHLKKLFRTPYVMNLFWQTSLWVGSQADQTPFHTNSNLSSDHAKSRHNSCSTGPVWSLFPNRRDLRSQIHIN